MLRLISLV
jgi:hypothetical protein